MKCVIIGASGQLGNDIVAVFSQNKKNKIIKLEHTDIEVMDKQSVQKALDRLSFDVLISTAAYHRVDDIEQESEKAFSTNAIGAKNLAQYCQDKGVTLVFFSTDYVFGADKKRNRPYREDDLPGPVNTYGVTKLASEYLVQSFCERHFIVRTSGLFGIVGSSGKSGNFVETMLKLANGGEKIKVVNDQILSPTYTKNLALQLELLLKTKKYGLYHCVSNESCSWFEFAKEIFKLCGIKADINPVSSKTFKRVANRPGYSALANNKITKLGINVMNNWRDNLELYLLEKGYI